MVAYRNILSLSHTHTRAHTPSMSERVKLRECLSEMSCLTEVMMMSLIGSELMGAVIEADRKLEKRVPRETRCSASSSLRCKHVSENEYVYAFSLITTYKCIPEVE